MRQYLNILALLTFAGLLSFQAISQNLIGSPHFLEARKKALEEEKVLLVHFTASWSNPCSKMFSTTYRNPEIRETLQEKIVFTLVDIDDFDGYVLGQHYGINNLPTLVLFDHKGRILKKYQGLLNEQDLMEFLNIEGVEPDVVLSSATDNSSPGLMERINDAPGETKDNTIQSYYAIQLGAFTDKSNAEHMMHSFSAYSIHDLHLQSELLNNNRRYLLLGGKFASREQAEVKLKELRNQGKDGFIKHLKNNDG